MGEISVFKKMAIGLVRLYQKGISPYKPAVCRFTPTCSSYAITAIQRFGVFLGCLMAFFRILRCNPLFRGGYDPVPKKFTLKPFGGIEKISSTDYENQDD